MRLTLAWGVAVALLATPIAALEVRGVAAPLRAIESIQGSGHRSPHEGERVATIGIVTAVDTNGFYLQSPVEDGDPATSAGLFVYTGSSPAVLVGDEVQVTGTVSEFAPAERRDDLTLTELVDPVLDALFAAQAPLPAPTVIGVDGRPPPTERIDDDGLAVFDPEHDALDFYESLEGMRVRLPDAVAVGPRIAFSEFWVVVDAGADATGRSRRGSLVLRASDANPERIQVQLDAGLLPGAPWPRSVGDGLGDVVGVVGYGFGNFEVRPTEPFTLEPGGLEGEATALVGDERHLVVATFNVENLEPGDADRVRALAEQIVGALRSPALLALQEIQDDDGPADTGNVDAEGSWKALVTAIAGIGGPRYAWVDRPPEDGADGGQPGGNIRVGYLFDPARIRLVPGSVERLLDRSPGDGDVFARSRKPLAARFEFAGRHLLVVNLHLTSRGGSTPLFGAVQPPEVGGLTRRIEQAAELRSQLEARVAADPTLEVIVLGDLNEFAFGEPLRVLEGEGAPPLLTNLAALEPEEERYSFLFEGNAQQLDHTLVSPGLRAGAQLDVVHVNAEFVERASDHDPVVARLPVAEPSARSLGVAGLGCVLALAAWRRGDSGRLSARSRDPVSRGRRSGRGVRRVWAAR